MKKLTLEYIAGFVDGEGCFMITYCGKACYRPVFSISNTNLQILKDIQKYLYLNLKITGAHPKKPNHKTCYHLTAHGINDCKAIARLLEPYLRLKKEHAQIIMQYPRAQTIRKGPGSLPDLATKAYVKKLRSRISRLNGKGPAIKEVI